MNNKMLNIFSSRHFYSKGTKVFFAFIFFALLTFCAYPPDTHAQVEKCDPMTVNVILRDASGNFIPNLNYEIYVQEYDVDGKPKPTAMVSSGKIDPNLGRGVSKFTSRNTQFALRAYHKIKTSGSFWFYNDIKVSCGGTAEVTERLSEAVFHIRDASGVLVKNKKFKVYSQKYDADFLPIKEIQDLVGELDLSEEGEAVLYLPDSATSIDGRGTDYYVLEVPGENGGVYLRYDISINAGRSTSVDYVMSDAKVIVKDESGVLFPAKEKVTFYRQITNDNNEKEAGAKIVDLYTDDKGEIVFKYPAGTYMAKVIGASSQVQNYWDIEIVDQKRSEYELRNGGEWQANSGKCEKVSTFNLSVLNLQDQAPSDLKYEVLEQALDAKGAIMVGPLFFSGTLAVGGKDTKTINPDPRKKYVLKIYGVNKSVGAYYFYNEIQFVCGENISLQKKLSALKIILRDGGNELVKNKKFSLYTQKIDVDGFPIREKKDLIGTAFSTNDQGQETIYLSPRDAERDKGSGIYVLEVIGENNKTYIEYDIYIENDKDNVVDYVFSDLVLDLKKGNGLVAKDYTVSVYKRATDVAGNYILGSLEQSLKTGANGLVRFPLPSGFYAIAVKDSLNNNIVFWQAHVANRKRINKNLKLNQINLSVVSVPASTAAQGYKIYELNVNEKGLYARGKLLNTNKTAVNGSIELSLAPNPYLFVVEKNKAEYGQAIYAENGKTQNLEIKTNVSYLLKAGQTFALKKPASDIPLNIKLKGRILLQTQANGEAWYVDMKTKKRIYLKNGATAYEMMRKLGLGISNENLKKIPIGLDDRFSENDYDGDYLSDKMEEAIGTDMYKHDSDGDGYSDGDEIKNNFNPAGTGAIKIDQNLANALKGNILLQVESKGEAWYVNPDNGKRYYMKDGGSAYEVMRFLSLGITNENLEEIEIGKLN